MNDSLIDHPDRLDNSSLPSNKMVSKDEEADDVRLSKIYTEKVVTTVKSNQYILFVTLISFLLFVIAEIIGALASGSLSLLGDAGAMSVDVFTYGVNMAAEYLKAKNGGVLSKETRMWLEVIIPTFSVCCLLAITGWVTSDAIKVIQDHGADDDVDVVFLYAYASANAVVDVVSNYMFWERKHEVFENVTKGDLNICMESNSISRDIEGDGTRLEKQRMAKDRNLNMLSAFTHLGSDSLRTLAVFVAAVIISTDKGVSSSLVDAWAAVIVTITIVAFVIPLMYGVITKYQILTADETLLQGGGNSSL